MSRTKHKVMGLVCGMLLAPLVGCGNGGDGAGSGEAVSLDRVVTLADEVRKGGADSCPLPYDAGKAGEAAGLDQEIQAGAAGAEADDPVASAGGGKTTDPQSAWAGKTGAYIMCFYHVGSENLEIYTVGTEEGNAVYVMAPRMQSAGSMGVEELKAGSEKAAKAELGEAVPSRSGNVVTVRLDSGGKGDVALMLSAGENGKTSLKPQQVLDLARAFAAQAK